MEIETDHSDDTDIYLCHRGIDGGPRWEACLRVECGDCGSSDTGSDVTGDMLMAVCHDCWNWYVGPASAVLFTDDRFGEIRWDDHWLPFALDGRTNRW